VGAVSRDPTNIFFILLLLVERVQVSFYLAFSPHCCGDDIFQWQFKRLSFVELQAGAVAHPTKRRPRASHSCH
jgi:hypothetical protein